MGCINPDNSLSETAKKLLQIVRVSASVEQIAKELDLPIFKIRSSIREMTKAGLITEMNEQYVISEKGKELLTK
jgi:predicted transcriptional regulator